MMDAEQIKDHMAKRRKMYVDMERLASRPGPHQQAYSMMAHFMRAQDQCLIDALPMDKAAMIRFLNSYITVTASLLVEAMMNMTGGDTDNFSRLATVMADNFTKQLAYMRDAVVEGRDNINPLWGVDNHGR